MTEKKSSHSKVILIKSIYSYFMLIVSIFLLITGIGSGVRILIYSMVFDEYPIPDEKYICQDVTSPARKDEESEVVVDQECLKKERKLRQIDDGVSAAISTVAGLILVFPHAYLVKSLGEHEEKQ